MAHQLLTDDDRARLLANGQARAAGQGADLLPVVRLITPDAHANWLLAWLDPDDGDTAHGIIDLDIACRPWAPFGSPSWNSSSDHASIP